MAIRILQLTRFHAGNTPEGRAVPAYKTQALVSKKI